MTRTSKKNIKDNFLSDGKHTQLKKLQFWTDSYYKDALYKQKKKKKKLPLTNKI